MIHEGHQKGTMGGWSLSPRLWIAIASVAILLELINVVQLVLPLFEPIDTNRGAPPLEIFEFLIRIITFLALLVWTGIPLLIQFLAVWRRWANAGKRHRNYWVWTSIEGVVVLLSVLWTIIMTGDRHGHTNSFPFFLWVTSILLWVTHTIAIPSKEILSKEPAVSENSLHEIRGRGRKDRRSVSVKLYCPTCNRIDEISTLKAEAPSFCPTCQELLSVLESTKFK